MMLFVKHYNIYLPTGWVVPKYPVHIPVTSDGIALLLSVFCDKRLFTVEQKKDRIRHKLLYVKSLTSQL